MNHQEREYLRTIMAKRDEYLRARDQEHIVPMRPRCLTGYACVYETQAFIENLTHEWRERGYIA